MGKRSNSKRLDSLVKRHNFLAKRIMENKAKDLSFDKAEAGSLEWAITVLAPIFDFKPELTKWRTKEDE